uniref:Uncharacterized protein n=1 Tax=Trachysalambria curvirostris majanivirus TaxID=2984281 RepID=A0A9C7CE06_9VIRU|nr:MAG: hypothetical protein [Trachysalambria curvirostris majanivirus]
MWEYIIEEVLNDCKKMSHLQCDVYEDIIKHATIFFQDVMKIIHNNYWEPHLNFSNINNENFKRATNPSLVVNLQVKDFSDRMRKKILNEFKFSEARQNHIYPDENNKKLDSFMQIDKDVFSDDDKRKYADNVYKLLLETYTYQYQLINEKKCKLNHLIFSLYGLLEMINAYKDHKEMNFKEHMNDVLSIIDLPQVK